MIAKYVTLAVLFGLALGKDYECGNDSLVTKERGKDVPATLPWAVLLKAQGKDADYDICPGILISDTEIITYGCSYQRGGWVKVFTGRKKVLDHASWKFLDMPATIIKDSEWKDRGDSFAVLKLKKSLELSKSVAPICLSQVKPNDISDKLFFYWGNNISPRESMKTITYTLRFEKLPYKGLPLFATYKSDGKWYFDEKASGYQGID